MLDEPPRLSSLSPISLSRVFWYSYLLTALTWALTFSVQFQSFVSKYIPRILSHKFSKTFVDLLPPVPTTLSQAFKLGQMESELTRLEAAATKNITAINNLLLSATNALNRHVDEMITSTQLHGILDRIISIENETSMISKIGGIFSFVNVIWFLSIIGIAVTIIPASYFCCKPIWDAIFDFFKLWFTMIGNFLYKILFNKIAYNIYELFGYFICWYFMFNGYEANTNIGFWISFTGLALWMPMQYISMIRWGTSNAAKNLPMLSLLSSALSIPIAYYYNSKILGFTSIAGLYSYLGFFIAGFFGGYIIGFQGDQAMANCFAASCIFNMGLIIAKLMNLNLTPMRMFIGPTLIMANAVMFLALLIHTSEWRSWSRRNNKVDYFQRQAIMIGSLLVAIAFGNILNYPAMSNTAYVYCGLYILQKMAESPVLWRDMNIIFAIFGLSIIGWRVALYLHSNPQIITGMVELE